MTRLDALIVGGGFYGGRIAQHLAERGARVRVIEREAELLTRASLANQARIHNGYHYPRSVVTALRSRVNAPRFVAEYPHCVSGESRMVYAVARHHSKIRAAQFQEFCDRVGATVTAAPPEVMAWFDPEFIEAVFEVWEPVFDAMRLRTAVTEALAAAGVEVSLESEVTALRRAEGGGVEATVRSPAGEENVAANRCFNCTYAGLNTVLRTAGEPPIPLKHEWTELALVRVPPALRATGVTVMDGPFFSLLPFPSRGLHTLSHVRYTPHRAWHDDADHWHDNHTFAQTAPRETNVRAMQADAARYLPMLRELEYVESIWEVKTVLPKSEVDDGRPILFRAAESTPGLYSVLGSKIDNVYDVLAEFDALPGTATLPV